MSDGPRTWVKANHLATDALCRSMLKGDGAWEDYVNSIRADYLYLERELSEAKRQSMKYAGTIGKLAGEVERLREALGEWERLRGFFVGAEPHPDNGMWFGDDGNSPSNDQSKGENNENNTRNDNLTRNLERVGRRPNEDAGWIQSNVGRKRVRFL